MNYLSALLLLVNRRSPYVLFGSITLSPSDVPLYLKFVAIASFTILCWDHMITFEDEVRFMTILYQQRAEVFLGRLNLV